MSDATSLRPSASVQSSLCTGAIHIYGGDFFGTPRSDWDPETLEERPYDADRARKVIVDANERWLAERERAGGS